MPVTVQTQRRPWIAPRSHHDLLTETTIIPLLFSEETGSERLSIVHEVTQLLRHSKPETQIPVGLVPIQLGYFPC